MRATYEALCAEGYSELTVQSIADRTELSKSAIFYHHDSKEALLADFVEYLLEGFEARFEAIADAPAPDRLAAFIEWSLQVPPVEEAGFHTAILELRAQAPRNDRYRDVLRRADDVLGEALTAILRDGIAEGRFDEHDPAALAELLLAAFDGARVRRLTLDRATYTETVREELLERVLADVLAAGVELPAEPAVAVPPDGRLASAFVQGAGSEGAPNDEERATSESEAE